MAATDQERLLLLLEAQTKQFERAINQARSVADREALAIEKRFQRMNATASRDFENFRNQIAAGVAAIGLGVAVQDASALADKWVRVGNALAFAGVEASSLAATQQIVADIAARTANDLESTAELFARLNRTAGDLGATMGDVAAATEIVAMALAGASATERAGAVVQLGQGLASGRLQGDELRSILENSRVLSEAIAAEFDTTVGNLRELGKTGQLESRRVFQAILQAGPEIEAAFARTTFTIADSFKILETEAARFIGTNEQTSTAARNTAAMIQYVAQNFHTLAAAAIVAATVIGGALAGVALAKAITALRLLGAEMLATGVKSQRLQALVGFLGGPLGIALTVAGAGMAYLATQTDFFASKAQVAAQAQNSLYTALQVIVSMSEAVEENRAANEDASAATSDAAGANDELAEAAGRAAEQLAEADSKAGKYGEQLGIVERAARALAEAEKTRAIATLEAAIADQEAVKAQADRARIFRGILSQGRFGFEFNEAERQQIADANTSIATLRDGLEAIRALGTDAFSAATGASENENTNTPTRPSSGRTVADLERQAELSLARLRHETLRVQQLEDAEDIAKRTEAYETAGLARAEARAKAESEVAAERAAMNEEALRSLNIAILQDEAELARAEGLGAIADRLRDEIELRERIQRLIEAGVDPADAERRATEFIDRQRAAREADLERQRETRDLENEAELARARGDDRAAEAAERRLAIERRIAELRGLGIDPQEAARRAEAEVSALEQADLQGKFRDWFRDGALAALDGDFGEFFQDWLAERWRNAMSRALDQVADQLFNLVRGAFSQGAGDKIGGVIGSIFGPGWSLSSGGGPDITKLLKFGGNRANGGSMQAGMGYWVGERGAEYVIPQTPSYVVPAGVMAGGAVNYVDRSSYHFQGTSEELAQFKAVYENDVRSRRQSTLAFVNDGRKRRSR